MKKLILLLLLIPSLLFAGSIQSAHKSVIARQTVAVGGENIEVGYTTIGSSNSEGAGRRIEFTVPVGGMTVTHGYVYGKDDGNGRETQMAIFTTGGVQQGSCSTEISVSDTTTWNEVIFTVPIELSAGTYALVNNTSGTLTYYYDEVGSNNYYGAGSCPTFPTTSSTRKSTITVADYDAH